MTTLSSETLHASCVAINGRAVLIEGLSGSGKSDLALRLIDRGAVLVSDDYTVVRRSAERLIASAAPNIAGLIEVRGIGLVPMPAQVDVSVAMIVTISDDVTRMPDDDNSKVIVGVAIPRGHIVPFESSAPIKVELMLERKGLK